jgi:hypothetical protein
MGASFRVRGKTQKSVVLVRKRTILTERPPLVGEVSADRRCHVVSSIDPHGRILDFLEGTREKETVILPITVAARFESWVFFARLNAEIVGSKPTKGMDICIVCVYSVFMLFCV